MWEGSPGLLRDRRDHVHAYRRGWGSRRQKALLRPRRLDPPNHLHRIGADRRADFKKLDDIQPALTALVLRYIGLGPPQLAGDIQLRQARLGSGIDEQFPQ